MKDEVQVLCDPSDPNVNMIATRMKVLEHAVATKSLVAISCKHGETNEDAILLAVMIADETGTMAEYAPIGKLYYPDDESYMQFNPPQSALAVPEDKNGLH